MGSRIIKISKYRPSIFQSKLDFSAARGSLSLSVEHPTERRIFKIICVALVALACGYVYFVSASVLNVMARRDALAHVTRIQGAIGGLEQHYFALSQSVSPESGSAVGLKPVADTQYVYRPGNVGAATIDRNAI